MEQIPTDRATNSELGGWFREVSEALRLELKPVSQRPVAECKPPQVPGPQAQRDASSRSMTPAHQPA